MTKKHTQTTLDVSIEYSAIGLDLAKYDVSLAAVTLNGIWTMGIKIPRKRDAFYSAPAAAGAGGLRHSSE